MLKEFQVLSHTKTRSSLSTAPSSWSYSAAYFICIWVEPSCATAKLWILTEEAEGKKANFSRESKRKYLTVREILLHGFWQPICMFPSKSIQKNLVYLYSQCRRLTNLNLDTEQTICLCGIVAENTVSLHLLTGYVFATLFFPLSVFVTCKITCYIFIKSTLFSFQILDR